MMRKVEELDTPSQCGLGCTLVGGAVTGSYFGVIFWKNIVWTAMEAGGVDFTGRVVITVLGGGELAVVGGATLGVCGSVAGLALIGGLGYCAYKGISSCASSVSSMFSQRPTSLDSYPNQKDLISARVTQRLRANGELLDNLYQLLLDKKDISWGQYDKRRNDLMQKLTEKNIISKSDFASPGDFDVFLDRIRSQADLYEYEKRKAAEVKLDDKESKPVPQITQMTIDVSTLLPSASATSVASARGTAAAVSEVAITIPADSGVPSLTR